ncbi:hypothetical protein NY547_03185 [Cnuibacter physcomitrellae]|uniref:glycosyltransferase family protein n=1 Tax=Cnuibacter physcomitrellae TaxID=1619308 RepID=UPI002175CFDB|nr:glycosyltransferase [Cnuibacter physcomitrellae]MCS5496242.1 hypothetical protein [Cnuibacter physcomitrellae]
MSGILRRARKGAFAARRGVRRAVGRLRGAPRLTWSLRISAPAGPAGDVWGDVYYAEDLAAALRRLGQEVYVDRLEQRIRPVARLRDDVVLQLTGLHRPELVPGAVNVIWVISHPECRDAEELRRFDLRYAASGRWAARIAAEDGVEVRALPQATAPDRFTPRRSGDELTSDVLFVGKTRRVFRPIVRDAVAVGADLTIYGDGWGDFIDPSHVAAEFLDNARVPDAYRGARIVLNDHWREMAEEGFLSNRLFDAVAAGARVISDPVESKDADFGGAVRFAATQEELAALLDPAEPGWPDDARMREIAADVAARHSFDRRAETLLADVLAVRGRRGGA